MTKGKKKVEDTTKQVDKLTVSDEVKEVEDEIISTPETVSNKVIENKGVIVKIASTCAWCGAGQYTQTIVFCSEACKNSYLAEKGLAY